MIHNVVILLKRINYCSGRNRFNSHRNCLVVSVKIDRVRVEIMKSLMKTATLLQCRVDSQTKTQIRYANCLLSISIFENYRWVLTFPAAGGGRREKGPGRDIWLNGERERWEFKRWRLMRLIKKWHGRWGVFQVMWHFLILN